MERSIVRLVSPVIEHLEAQPQQKAEYLLMSTVYLLMIVLLSIAIWYRGSPVSTAIVAVFLAIVVAEAVFVLYYKRGSSMCEICRDVACDTFKKTKG